MGECLFLEQGPTHAQAERDATIEDLEKKTAAFKTLRDEHDVLNGEMSETKRALMLLQDLVRTFTQ